MRKSSASAPRVIALVLPALLWICPQARPADTPAPTVATLSNALVDRAEAEVSRIQALVAQGVLPKTRLLEAEDKLSDARDEAVLAATLYGQPRVQDMTPDQAAAMTTAAQNRVDRQQKTLAHREELLAMGILSRSDLAADQDELEARKRVLGLAQNRVQLMDELRQMAETEQRLKNLSRAATSAVVIRYDGDGLFQLADLPRISAAFESRFRRPLPVSAVGETVLHRSMGLDHRNRVDVALSPDSPEGLWLRSFLERLQIPYLAFRSALAGAATAPHIHIGLGSNRLNLAGR
ncbi:MAG: hypothetical protein JO319_19950 [Acidobacteriaceae bacterium]|nr:hypothetical protein [Acidobacteriaceae bacterium]